MREPTRVRFTSYAEQRAAQRGLSLQEIGALILEEHGARRRNPGHADWIVRGRGIAVVYNWPAAGDTAWALVVTVWPE